MPLARDRQLFMLGMRFLDTVHASVIPTHILVGIEAMSLVAETEDFSTYRNVYITSARDAEVLLSFKARCLTALQAGADMERRKLLRPLVDSIDRAKRQYRLK